MDIKGTWKISEMLSIDEDLNRVWKPVEQVKAEDPDENIYDSQFIFCENGDVLTVLPIPEGTPDDLIAEAVAAGEIELYGDNMMLLEKKRWKEENGHYFYDTGMTVEIEGNDAASPWTELEPYENGWQLLVYRIVKI